MRRGRLRTCPPITSVFVGGGTPSLVDPAALLAVLEPLPDRAPAPRSPSSATPTTSPSTSCGPTGTVASPASRSACSRWCRTCSPPSAAPTTRRRCAPRSRPRRASTSTSTSTSSTAARASRSADWERSLDEAIALGPDHVSAYALTVEPGTPLAADPARHPDDDDQADKYHRRRRAPDRGRVRLVRDLELGPKPGHECRHNLLYWSQGEYLGHRLRRPLPPRRPPVLEPAHARALHRRRRAGPLAPRPPTSGSTPTAAASRACSSASAPPAACPPPRSTTPASSGSTAWSRSTPTGPASPAAVASWPTRSPSTSGEPVSVSACGRLRFWRRTHAETRLS